jgi:hypothetical protein
LQIPTTVANSIATAVSVANATAIVNAAAQIRCEKAIYLT